MAEPTPTKSAPLAESPFEHTWRGNTLALSLGAFHNTMGFTIYFPFLPFIVMEMGVEGELETVVGMLVGAFFVVSFLLGPVWGGMADHFGRKTMVLRAGFGMGIGFALLAMAPNLWWFLPFYALVGVFNGYVPAAMALVATNTPPRRMGRAISTLQTLLLLGTTVGPALGAFLAGVLPMYRYLFWFSSGASLVAGTVALFFTREVHIRPEGPFRLHLIADARKILRAPRMGLLMMLNFIFSLSFFGSTTVVAVYTLQMAKGQTHMDGLAMETWVGLVALALTISSALAAPVWGRLLDRFEPRLVLAIGLGLTTASLLPIPFVTTPLELTIVRVLLGLLSVGCQPAVVQLIKLEAPSGMEARALALGSSMMMLGNGGGPFLAGIIGPLMGLPAYFGFNALLVLVGLVLWVLLGVKARSRL